MATQAEATAHRAVVSDVETLAVAGMVDAWADLPVGEPTLAQRFREALGDLIDTFHPIAATVGADWYEELRTEAKVPGRFVASLADAPPDAMASAITSWVTGTTDKDEPQALADASAALQRIVALADRQTIELNAGRDPHPTRWARYASSTACAFCAMLATRGPVYRSEDSAAGKYHNHCRCIAVPVWNATDYDEAPYVADWREAYYAATTDLGGANDTKAILAHLREHADLR